MVTALKRYNGGRVLVFRDGRVRGDVRGSAHRGANGVAMPTDEDDQDGHFFYNHPERGAYFAA